MRCASGLSTQHELGPAASELAGDLAAALGGMEPELVFAFATGHEVADLVQLPGLLQPWLGDGLLIGCNGSGVAGGGREQEDGPALALMAAVLIGVDLAATNLEQAMLPPVTAAREAWWHAAGVRPETEPAFTLLADPYSFDIEHCARGLVRAFPGATVIGGQASVAQRGQACLLAGRDLHQSGALLLSWTGNVALEAVVSQGCRAAHLEEAYVPLAHSHMDLVSPQWRAECRGIEGQAFRHATFSALRPYGFNLCGDLPRLEHGRDIEQAEPSHDAAGALYCGRIVQAPAEHLVAPADPYHLYAACMGFSDAPAETALLQKCEITEGVLRAGDYDQVRVLYVGGMLRIDEVDIGFAREGVEVREV